MIASPTANCTALTKRSGAVITRAQADAAKRRGANGTNGASVNQSNQMNHDAPWQKEATMSYSFFQQSKVRYPAASLADHYASQATYEDSELDKTAIQVNVHTLAEAAGIDPGTLNGGDTRSFAALAEAASGLGVVAAAPSVVEAA